MTIDKKRALTDVAYRRDLSPEQLAELEASLTEEDLEKVAGGLPCQVTGGSCLASKRSTITCQGHC